jgi:hypothetical protein
MLRVGSMFCLEDVSGRKRVKLEGYIVWKRLGGGLKSIEMNGYFARGYRNCDSNALGAISRPWLSLAIICPEPKNSL